MRTRVVRIGNSRGIRIPKPLIEELGLGDELELTVKNRGLLIRPLHRPRAGWSEAFGAMGKRGDDTLLDRNVPSLACWDEVEWEW